MTAPDLIERCAEDTYPRPPHGWTCFHCGETFTVLGLAAEHFGADTTDEPACRIKVGHERNLVAALREAEGQLSRYRAEDSDADRAMYRMRADHAVALRCEEEKGYTRGLQDARAEFLAYVHSPEIVEKIVNRVCNMHRWIFDETTRYHVVDDFKDILDALAREVSGETNPRAQK